MSIAHLVRLLAIAAALLVTTASAASALTVTPSGNYTVSSGTAALGFTSNGQRITCTSSRIAANVGSNGVGTIPVGGVTFSSCINSLLGPFTVTQTSAWPMQVVLSALPDGLSTLVGLQVTIPARGIMNHDRRLLVHADGHHAEGPSIPAAATRRGEND